ncbi:hypothetical protein D3C72_2399390 [compost metagenome]
MADFGGASLTTTCGAGAGAGAFSAGLRFGLTSFLTIIFCANFGGGGAATTCCSFGEKIAMERKRRVTPRIA